MKNFALVGKDIRGSFSPDIHSFCFESLSLEACYHIIDIESSSDISAVVSRLKLGDLDGINITAPYKKDFISHLDHLNPRAEDIGSINCIHSNNGKLIGNNTDWFGFGQSIRDFQEFDNVVIIGGGGVVPAIVYYIETRLGCPIHIIGRDLKKLEHFQTDNISIHDIQNFNLDITNSIIINTVPSENRVNWAYTINSITAQPQFAMDLNYHLKATEFLNYFNSSVEIKNGLDMLIHQALMSIDIWFNENLSKSIHFEDLKDKISARYNDEYE